MVPKVQHLFRSPLPIAIGISVVILGCAVALKARDALAPKTAATTAETPSLDAAAPAQGADWQQEMMLLGLATSTNPSETSDHDPIEMIGPVVVAQLVGQYAGLVESNSFNAQSASQAGDSIAANVRASISYKTYTMSDLTTDTDVSYARMLSYRTDLRKALEPLLDNKDPELDTYAKFVETSDPQYLSKLTAAAKNYRLAAENASKIRVPRDAVNYHLDILNAMQEFAATLDAMTGHSADVFGSVALLRTYNTAEQNMFMTFDALSGYYGQKTP